MWSWPLRYWAPYLDKSGRSFFTKTLTIHNTIARSHSSKPILTPPTLQLCTSCEASLYEVAPINSARSDKRKETALQNPQTPPCGNVKHGITVSKRVATDLSCAIIACAIDRIVADNEQEVRSALLQLLLAPPHVLSLILAALALFQSRALREVLSWLKHASVEGMCYLIRQDCLALSGSTSNHAQCLSASSASSGPGNWQPLHLIVS
eukprot:3454715-Amphidinium_carterae.1